MFNKMSLLQDAVMNHIKKLESAGDVGEHEKIKLILPHHKTLNDPSNSHTYGDWPPVIV